MEGSAGGGRRVCGAGARCVGPAPSPHAGAILSKATAVPAGAGAGIPGVTPRLGRPRSRHVPAFARWRNLPRPPGLRDRGGRCGSSPRRRGEAEGARGAGVPRTGGCVAGGERTHAPRRYPPPPCPAERPRPHPRLGLSRGGCAPTGPLPGLQRPDPPPPRPPALGFCGFAFRALNPALSGRLRGVGSPHGAHPRRVPGGLAG